MRKYKLIVVFLLFLSAADIYAADLTGEGELGFTSTSGNADSQSLNAKIGLGKEHA